MISYTLVGRLIKDAESVSVQSGKLAEKFTIAVNFDRDKSKLYTCYYFGDRAAKLHDYLRRGRQVFIIGNPSWREYEGKEYESVTVVSFEFCGSKSDADGEFKTPPKQDNPEHLPYQCDGRYFRTREEMETYKKSKYGDNLSGPESFEDDDMSEIPF